MINISLVPTASRRHIFNVKFQMNNIALPSVQSLLIEMRFRKQPLATGTAFVIHHGGKPFLITNRHNVTGRNQETNQPISSTGGVPDGVGILHNRKGHLGQWVQKLEPLYANEKPRWFEHPELKERADFVALPLSDLDDVEFYHYDLVNLGPKIMVGPADSVSVIGFPFGITAGGPFGVWATGFMASEPVVNFTDLPIQLIDCRSRQGQSGSPVIAYRSGGMIAMEDGGSAAFGRPIWRLIGIYCGRINAESDLGIVWRASAIKEMVERIET